MSLNGGNVGIATTSPEHKLQIGDASGAVSLSLRGPDGAGSSGSVFFEDTGGSGARWFKITHNTASNQLLFSSPEQNALLTLNRGNGLVGIGTTDPDAKLTVKGDIHTNEVRVDMDPRVVPDYVFEKDYNLLPLSEIEAYVNQNKHLPEVPSAKEMEENGLNLKEMNLLLLKKVEELTLHIIHLEKRSQVLEAEVETLKNKK